MSFFLVPEWKGAAKAGWVSCFLAGKTALTPLVLWAVAALYAVEVLRVARRTAFWIVHGFLAGALVSAVCALYGVAMLVGAIVAGSLGDVMFLWLLVPFHVAVWYSIRLVQVVRQSPLEPKDYLFAGVSSAPFWIGSVVWSSKIYESLPDQPPSCFVVTAASRGHRSLVGPFVEVSRKGRVLRANRQLLTLWEFEALWRAHSPQSHVLFRKVYDVIGPAVARKIALPWLADMAYVCLKPVEFFAAAVLCGARANGESKRTIMN